MQLIPSNLPSLINEYKKNLEIPTEKPSQKLEKIKDAVQELLSSHPTKENAQEIRKELKALTVQSNDIEIWGKIFGAIEKVSPSSQGSIEQLPVDLYEAFIRELDLKGIYFLAQTNKKFHEFIYSPKSLSFLLNKYSALFSPQKRFELALLCGIELTQLNLSKFNDLNSEQLKQLKEKCPNLKSLDLSYTSLDSLIFPDNLKELNLYSSEIKKLDTLPKSLIELNLGRCHKLKEEEFENLNNSFTALEKLDVSKTKIAKLSMLPKSLKELGLNDCANLKQQELKKINELFSELKLDAGSTQAIDFEDILSRNPHLIRFTTEELKALLPSN